MQLVFNNRHFIKGSERRLVHIINCCTTANLLTIQKIKCNKLGINHMSQSFNGRMACVCVCVIPTIRTPRDHQSALCVCPLLLTTSGAIYSTVPQKEYAFLSWSTDSLLSPKSATGATTR